MLLDPYITTAVSEVTSKQIFDSFINIYPDIELNEEEDIVEIDAWLKKLRVKLGRALSTGGRNSMKGVFTCALLHALGVKNPKAARNRLDLAWSIIASPVGARLVGLVPELDELYKKRFGASYMASEVEPRPENRIKLPLIIGNVYSDQKQTLRRICWTDGRSVLYEVLSAELKNGIGRRVGYSVDGNPVYESVAGGFRLWAKQTVQMDVIQRSVDAVPVNLLGKVFRARNGIVHWLCPSTESPLYIAYRQMSDGLWLNGWRGLNRPWLDCEILGEPPEGAEYEVIENNERVTKIVKKIRVEQERTVDQEAGMHSESQKSVELIASRTCP